MTHIEIAVADDVDPNVKKTVGHLMADKDFMKMITGIRSVGSSCVFFFTKKSHKSVDRAIALAKLQVTGEVDVRDNVFDWGIKLVKRFPVALASKIQTKGQF